jgi:hypothetical protein
MTGGRVSMAPGRLAGGNWGQFFRDWTYQAAQSCLCPYRSRASAPGGGRASTAGRRVQMVSPSRQPGHPGETGARAAETHVAEP